MLNILIALMILAMPGPTNCLLSIAAATMVHRKQYRLVVPVVSAYVLAAMAFLTLTTMWGVTEIKGAKLVGAAVLVHVAVGLWRGKASVGAARVTVSPMHVFLTTLVNPKALIVVTLFADTVRVSLASKILLVSCLLVWIVVVSIGWIALGATINRLAHSDANRIFERVGAIILSGFALVMLRAVVA